MTDLIKDLIALQDKVFEPYGFQYSELELETEGKAYKACRFKIENRIIIYRQAKLTPTKNGQFVTIWKRNSKGLTSPFDSSDNIDFFIVATKMKSKSGLFVFSKEALIKYGIISINHKGGKRGIRVYPSWDKPNSKQAEKTQKWQLEFFLELEI